MEEVKRDTRPYQRYNYLRDRLPNANDYVLQCCANDAHGLSLEESYSLYKNKYTTLHDELVHHRKAQVESLMDNLPLLAECKPETPKPKAKRSRVQGMGQLVKPTIKPDVGTAVVGKVPYSPFSTLEVPPHVMIREGLVLIQNAIPLGVQQQFARVSLALGTPTGEVPCGFYYFKPTGELALNEGDYGNFFERVASFPPQYGALCSHFMSIGRTLSPVLPPMNPTVVLVNYYLANSKGIPWHRDNSTRERKSAALGTPVVSVSLGDSADFEFKMEPTAPSQVVCLNSGDVLIFGGPSRMILHAVTKIYPNTMPKGLDMPPGRLNLTFRNQDADD